MRRIIGATLIATALSAGPAFADDKPTPEELLQDGARKILSAIELLLLAIPQYEAPVILDNGDILIRRVPKGDDNAPKPMPPTESET